MFFNRDEKFQAAACALLQEASYERGDLDLRASKVHLQKSKEKLSIKLVTSRWSNNPAPDDLPKIAAGIMTALGAPLNALDIQNARTKKENDSVEIVCHAKIADLNPTCAKHILDCTEHAQKIRQSYGPRDIEMQTLPRREHHPCRYTHVYLTAAETAQLKRLCPDILVREEAMPYEEITDNAPFSHRLNIKDIDDTTLERISKFLQDTNLSRAFSASNIPETIETLFKDIGLITTSIKRVPGTTDVEITLASPTTARHLHHIADHLSTTLHGQFHRHGLYYNPRKGIATPGTPSVALYPKERVRPPIQTAWAAIIGYHVPDCDNVTKCILSFQSHGRAQLRPLHIANFLEDLCCADHRSTDPTARGR